MWIEHAFLPGFLTGNENISNASMEGWFEDGLRTCGAEADAIDIEWGQRKGQFHVDHGYRERAHGRFAHVQRLQIRAEILQLDHAIRGQVAASSHGEFKQLPAHGGKRHVEHGTVQVVTGTGVDVSKIWEGVTPADYPDVKPLVRLLYPLDEAVREAKRRII